MELRTALKRLQKKTKRLHNKIIVVELLYSLKRILLLGGLNHASSIWLESGSYFIRFLSSRLGKTISVRIESFVVVTLGASLLCAGCAHTRWAAIL